LWVGIKSEIKNHCNYLVLPVKNNGSDKTWNLEVKAFNDGVAFRYVVPGTGDRKINSETTSFGLLKGSKIWYRLNKPQYERFSKFSDVEKIEADYNMQLPVTIELPDNMGHAAITEAGSFLYSGLSLKSTGSTHLKAYFADDSKGWTITGEIASPWRIIMTGPTLNDLVNCDIVPNVCPPPDPKLFPKGKMTEWIKPGRTMWVWWAYGKDGAAWDFQKPMVDKTQKLHCEYYFADYGWEEPKYGWCTKENPNKKWDTLKELVKYAKERNIEIVVWRHWHPLRSAKAQERFFAKLKECDVKCAKIDFLASEGVERRKFIIDALKVAQNTISWPTSMVPRNLQVNAEPGRTRLQEKV
jgi:alpha-glucosidase